MEYKNIVFKNKRQSRDFDFIYKNVYFDIDEIEQNKFFDILIDIAILSKTELQELKELVKNKKTVIVNETRKKIVII